MWGAHARTHGLKKKKKEGGEIIGFKWSTRVRKGLEKGISPSGDSCAANTAALGKRVREKFFNPLKTGYNDG